jgi:hypothetical protein
MITVIPMPKENQDASETVSLLPKVPYTQSTSKEAEEDMWVSLLPEGVKQENSARWRQEHPNSCHPDYPRVNLPNHQATSN